jgi:Flp pilus assembly protein TadG
MARGKRAFRIAAWHNGAAAAELAVALPLLLTITLGCVDFGRFAYAYITLTNACGEAATFASLHGPAEYAGGTAAWSAAVADIAVGECDTLNPPIRAEDVTIDTDILSEGRVQVTVAYEFQTLIPWPTIPAHVPMSKRFQMPQTP